MRKAPLCKGSTARDLFSIIYAIIPLTSKNLALQVFVLITIPCSALLADQRNGDFYMTVHGLQARAFLLSSATAINRDKASLSDRPERR